jgi:signal transduction histidine kinase
MGIKLPRQRNPVARLRWSYRAALWLTAITLVLAQVVVQYRLEKSVQETQLLNLAGRQRMLNEYLAKYSIMLQLPEFREYHELFLLRLDTALKQWQRVHHGLQHGDEALGLTGEQSDTLRRMFAEMNPVFDTLYAARTELLQLYRQQKLTDSLDLQRFRTQMLRVVPRVNLFLRQMDAIVEQYSIERTQVIRQVQGLQWALMGVVLLLLLLEALFIFRPAVQRLERLFTELKEANNELRVQNEEITSQQEELRQQADVIEQQNIELQQSIEQQCYTQYALGQQEKLVALGQLAQGIGHEINTPLGAINVANGLNVRYIAQLNQQNLWLLQRCTPAEAEALFHWLQASLARPPEALSSREARTQRLALTALLQENGIPDAGQTAAALVAADLRTDIAEYPALLQSAHAPGLLQLAIACKALAFNSHNIQLAVERSQRILGALRQAATGSTLAQPVPCVVQETLENVLLLYSYHFSRGIEVEKLFDDDPLTVLGKPDQLQQIWTNLIQNAVNVLNGTGQLQLIAERSGTDAVVSVVDNGPGIAPEVLPRVFEPYFTTRAHQGGTGIGLALVKQLVESHRGSIYISSQPGRTAFVVRLPLRLV